MEAEHDDWARLGEMVALARGIEGLVYDLANMMLVPKWEKIPVSDAMAGIKRSVGLGVPPWARGVDVEKINHWLDVAKELFERRNIYVHWRVFYRRADDTWIPQRYSARHREFASIDFDDLEDLITQFWSLWVPLTEISQGLLVPIKGEDGKIVRALHPKISDPLSVIQSDPQEVDKALKAWPDGWAACPDLRREELGKNR